MGKMKEHFNQNLNMARHHVRQIAITATEEVIVRYAQSALNQLDKLQSLVEVGQHEPLLRDPRQINLNLDESTGHVLSIYDKQRD